MKNNTFQSVEPDDKKLPFICILQDNKDKQIILPHWHDTYEIDYVLNSKNQNFYLDGSIFDQQKGEIVCVNPYQVHGLTLPQDSARLAITLVIPLAFLDSVNISQLNLRIQNRILDKKNKHYLLVIKLFKELYQILLSKENDDITRMEEIGIVYSILGMLFHYFSQKDSVKFKNYSSEKIIYIKKTLIWLQDNYMNPISNSDLAKNISLSTSYFSHLFKETVGKSPQEYLETIRVAHARQLIQNEKETMTEIAIKTGFPNTKSMIRSFKKYMNITPYQYRLNQKKAGYDIF